MMIALHKNAATTPTMRAYIQQSSASEYELPEELGVSRTTIHRWKKRNSVQVKWPPNLKQVFNSISNSLI
jgi:uncharacterized protein YjcR